MTTEFIGRGRPISAGNFAASVAILGGDAASLWALLAVQAGGFGFFADRRPRILFERHVFHRRTAGRFDHSHPDISDRPPGGYVGGTAEYDRLWRAIAPDRRAALESTSWGLGQVMGCHAHSVGFADVEAMADAMVASEGAQLRAAANFIAADPALFAAFRAREWQAVALHYNGADHAENRYDTNLAHHYEVFSRPEHRPDIGLRTAQVCLIYLGYSPGAVDGLNGPLTRTAIQTFQKDNGLAGEGIDADLSARLRADAGI